MSDSPFSEREESLCSQVAGVHWQSFKLDLRGEGISGLSIIKASGRGVGLYDFWRTLLNHIIL